MNILYWDIENVNSINVRSKNIFPNVEFDKVQCSFAKPFDNIDSRINLNYKTLELHQLHSRGPDLADFHLLSLVNMDIIDLGRDIHIYLVSADKLLSYRFIVLARNCSLPRDHIHTMVPDAEIRRRSKRGHELFEDGDLEKIPPSLNIN